jgi:NADPH-dependent curcumin reductase CurA
VGAPLEGGAVGRVVASRSPDLAEGDHVRHMLGWRSHALADARAFSKVDAEVAPLQAYLGILGMPGMTAYVGLLDIGEAKEGETVFVSGAAGAVGSTVGQIARIMGCRVVGSAGSPEKVAYLLDELGFDAAFDYREMPVAEALDAHCPDGIDVYFENVGGDHLVAALPRMRTFGRIAVCGLISQYNLEQPEPGPPLWPMIRDRITMRGFLVRDHGHRSKDFHRDVVAWLADGRLRERETIVEGLERMPEAFIGLFRGENIGKMVVAV